MSGFGVYVHVPFCVKRCDYCAFATFTDREHLIDRYMAACVAQADRESEQMPPVTSVFFGGGTPNLAAPAAIAELLDMLPLTDGAEVTVECNPDLVTTCGVRQLAAAGVNRVSMGVQSFVPHVLASLGRLHDQAAVYRAVEAVRSSGIEQLNVDIIYGAAGESLADWEATLRRTVDLGPTHVSAYGLTVEAGTPLADDPSRHPDDDDQASKYEMTDAVLAGGGYDNYEISNWAKPGGQCQHNLLYWRQGNYAAIGAAAHGHRDGTRWWNVRTPERYINAVEAGESPVAASEQLGDDERRVEALQLAIRTSRGVPPDSIDDEVAHLVSINDETGAAVLTQQGRLLANEVALRFT